MIYFNDNEPFVVPWLVNQFPFIRAFMEAVDD